MRIPMLLLAAGCVAIGLFAPAAVGLTSHAVGIVTGFSSAEVRSHMSFALGPLSMVVLAAGLLVLLIGLLAWARRILLSGRAVEAGGTWDCGYTRPSASMQYTASSFAQPLTKMFEPFLRPRVKWEKPDGLFPVHSSFHTETEDLFGRNLYRPIFLGVGWIASRLRFLQAGRVQFYVLYIALTIFILLIWNLR
jgi:predicted membrane channel-forming protein YqfA (hemolysin III family)